MTIMRTLLSVFLTGLFVLSVEAQTPKMDESLIVTTDWLANNINDDLLVILHVGDKNEYLAGHIPRAQFIQTSDLAISAQGLTLELPPVEQLKATLEKFGISNNSRIVVYFGNDWVSPTTRIFMTLDYMGLGGRTSVLDGGLPAWRGEGKPVTEEIVEPKKGNLTPHPKKDLVVDAAWVKSNLNNSNVRILDARAPQFYTGAELGRMPRGGHVPTARNIPFSSLIEESKKFKSVTTLQELFKVAEVKPSNTIATYCHIGQQATLLYFVARYLGYDARVYDGSFEDWSNRSELPVEKSKETKQ